MQKRNANSKKRRRWRMQVFNSFAEADDADRRYWFSRTSRQRMQALEQLRQMNFGYGPGKPELKFQRVVRVFKLGES
ncbi:MAG TPA: hypothetical protein VHZ30_01270 [Verrucomicrobiae bacterium]|jgi:hypothetical protein|nr:hypothetical protein [Verrucomicrobiae bacterium]